MKPMLEQIIMSHDLGFLPSMGVLILFLSMSAILVWTFRPSAKLTHEKNAKLIIDEERTYEKAR